MLLTSRFSLFVVLLCCSLTSLAAQSVKGFYLRPLEDKNRIVSESEIEELASDLLPVLGYKMKLEYFFTNATIHSLQKTAFLSLKEPRIAEDVRAVLKNSPLFSSIIAITDEEIVGGANRDDFFLPQENLSLDPDLPECSLPYEPNDPHVFDTEHFEKMQLPCAWSITQGSPDVTVAVVDWYFDVEHPEIQGKVLNPSSVAATEYVPRMDETGEYVVDSERHGTVMCAGAAGEIDNSICGSGTGGGSTLRVYSGHEEGGVLNAICRAVDEGNQVISLSIWSCAFQDGNTQEMVREVFQDAVNRGVVISFSVLCNNSIYLENISGVLLVGYGLPNGGYKPYCADVRAVDRPCPLYITEVSDSKVEFVVPSDDAYTLKGRNQCSPAYGGSSLGAAYLAGIVALMIDENPCLSPAEIERILYRTSVDVDNRECCHQDRFVEGKGLVNAYRAVEMASVFDPTLPDLIVEDGDIETIEDEEKFFNLIDVHPGGQLNIFNSRVSIDGNRSGPYNDGRITVQRGAKLIVRNSTLTTSRSSSCEFERWGGIRVHGNIDREQPNMFNEDGELEVNTPLDLNDAGVVMLLDETVIENAVNAVAATVPGLPYQDQVDRWGGLVIADRAIFRNNFRAAEFLRYPRQFSGNTFKNKSVFNECVFITTDEEDTRSLGITAWDTDGVTVTKSTFKNLGRESIVTIDGSFIIEDGNNFINEREEEDHRHIMSMATYPYSGEMTIGSKDEGVSRNKFYSGTESDVFIYASTSAGSGGVHIQNNDFYGNRRLFAIKYAVEIDGPSAYMIQGNFIEGANPFLFNNTGTDQFIRSNTVNCNTINNNRGAMSFRGNNSGCQFRENVFSGLGSAGSIFSAPAISIDGVVDASQGNASRPANNRFETAEQSVDILVQEGSRAFDYYYTDTGSPDDDVFEPRGESGYNKLQTSNPGILSCSFGKFQEEGIKEQDVLAMQNIYDNIRNSTNPEILEDLQQLEIAKANRDNLLNSYVDLALKEQNLNKINSLLTKIPDPEAKLLHFGACMKLGDHVGANSLLPTISAIGPVYNDFIDVQQINIERLQTTDEEFKLSETDYKTLDNVAKSESTSRGYARALLYLLKGKRYYDVYEQKSAIGKDDGESTIPNKSSLPLSVYPNPVLNGELKLVGDILDGDGIAVLRRMDGSIVSTMMFSRSEELTMIAPAQTGVYFIQVTRGKEISTVKVIIK